MDGARQNGKRKQTGQKCRHETVNETGGTTALRERRTTEQTTERNGLKRQASSARGNGKKVMKVNKRSRNKRGVGEELASRPQQPTQPNKLAVTPDSLVTL